MPLRINGDHQRITGVVKGKLMRVPFRYWRRWHLLLGVANLLTDDEQRQIASNIAKLPEFLKQGAGRRGGPMEPEKVEAIVCAYGAVLSAPDVFMGARDSKSLPYLKSDIKAALMAAYAQVGEDRREAIKMAYLALAEFQDLSDAELIAFQTLFRRGTKPISREEMSPEMMKYTADIFPVIARIGQETSVLIRELKAAGIA